LKILLFYRLTFYDFNIKLFILCNEIAVANNQILPFKALKTQAFAKKPTPTATNPHPEISLYLKNPNPISNNPITTINNVAQPKTVFLFIPIIEI